MANLYITASEARQNFFDLISKAKKGPYPVNITVKGVPEVVVMGKEDFDAWMATIETLSDPDLMKALKIGDRNIAKGEYSSLEEVEKELGLDVRSKSFKSGKKRTKKTR